MKNKYLEIILKEIHMKFKPQETYEHFIAQIDYADNEELSLFKRGVQIIKEQTDYEIHPTTYEVIFNMKSNEIVYYIGQLEVFREKYSYPELVNLFQHEDILKIMEPDPLDLQYYLKVFRLLNPQITIGNRADLNDIKATISKGHSAVGEYYEKRENEYQYLEVKERGMKVIIKEIVCESSDQIVYALAGGGNFEKTSVELKQIIFDVIRKKVRGLASEFNQEFLMSLLSIEREIEDYEELKRQVQLL